MAVRMATHSPNRPLEKKNRLACRAAGGKQVGGSTGGGGGSWLSRWRGSLCRLTNCPQMEAGCRIVILGQEAMGTLGWGSRAQRGPSSPGS